LIIGYTPSPDLIKRSFGETIFSLLAFFLLLRSQPLTIVVVAKRLNAPEAADSAPDIRQSAVLHFGFFGSSELSAHLSAQKKYLPYFQ